MTADLLSNLAAALGAWSARLLDVSWQAGLVAAGAWLLCRCSRACRRTSGRCCGGWCARSSWWAWRGRQPVGVPLLPASGEPVAVSTSSVCVCFCVRAWVWVGVRVWRLPSESGARAACPRPLHHLARLLHSRIRPMVLGAPGEPRGAVCTIGAVGVGCHLDLRRPAASGADVLAIGGHVR